MRLLFISSYFLFQDTRFGGTKRLYYLAREWERSADLTLICMDGCREWDGRPAPEGPGEFKDFLMLPGMHYPDSWSRCFRAPSDRRPALASAAGRIRAFLSGKSFDAVLLAYPWSLSFLGLLLEGIEAPVAFLDDDFIFEQYRNESRSAATAAKRLLKRFRHWQSLSFYRSRLAHASRFIAISEHEARIISAHFPALPCSIVKYGLPLEEFPLLAPPGDQPVIGFIGNYGHSPNLDALRWMCDEVMPAIRSRVSGARFVIAGRGLPEWARARLGADPDVTLREEIPDLAEFYASLAVFINPVRTGRGLRTKVLESAAYGRPILTTSLGAEGLEDLRLFIADGSEAMGDECARLLQDGRGRGSIAANRAIVESRYSLEKVATDLLRMLDPTPTRSAEEPGTATTGAVA